MSNRFAKYRKPTAELLLDLLELANKDQITIDNMLQSISEDVIKEFQELVRQLEKTGYLDINNPTKLMENPKVYRMVKEAEYKAWNKRMDTLFSWLNVVYQDSLVQTYQKSVVGTFQIFNQPLYQQINNYNNSVFHSLQMPKVIITDTYIKQSILPIPWCQDGKVYSQRLYRNVANFQSKLNFVLEEGINKGKGLDWMIESWRKLTGSSAYDAARLLKTETVAMWSRATKESYLQMGIEYIEIVGDAQCGSICLDYVGDIIPLKEAELGAELPPYHPNCACSYVAFEEEKEEENLDQED